MLKKVEKFIAVIYTYIFVRKLFYRFHLALFKISIRGIGILNYQNEKVSGEKFFLQYLKALGKFSSGVIFDVGANIGDYSVTIRENKISNELYSFEPHPQTYNALKINAEKNDFTAVKKGMSDNVSTAIIYDYSSNESSEHASLYKEVFSDIYKSSYRGTEIELSTIDLFVQENNINRIALLKIDTEGNELNVLKGAKETLAKGLIDIIQIEFNEMNVFSRTFMKDILDVLPSFTFFRLLPDGLVKLGDYKPIYFELFAFQNIVAIKN